MSVWYANFGKLARKLLRLLASYATIIRMNAFDEEMGPILETREAERIAALAVAGVTLPELQAYSRYLLQEVTHVQ